MIKWKITCVNSKKQQKSEQIKKRQKIRRQLKRIVKTNDLKLITEKSSKTCLKSRSKRQKKLFETGIQS